MPGSLPGGVYGLRLEVDGIEDVVAFAVRRAPAAEPAPNVLVLPTFTYLAYSCEREGPEAAASERPEDHWVVGAGLLARSKTDTRTASASTRRPRCGRSPSCGRTTGALSTVARTASPRT